MRWLAFQLNPDLPEKGVPRQEYVERKYGPDAARKHEPIAAAGKQLGIEFAFDAIGVQPNTANAHRLMLYGEEHGRSDEVAEALFRAYFQEGANIAEPGVLADIGARAGLERDALVRYLASDAGRDAVLHADAWARQAGIAAVPLFIFNRKYGLSGAHESATLLQAMIQAAQD